MNLQKQVTLSKEYLQERYTWELAGLIEGRDVRIREGDKTIYYAENSQTTGPWQGEVLSDIRYILNQFHENGIVCIPYTAHKKSVCFEVRQLKNGNR